MPSTTSLIPPTPALDPPPASRPRLRVRAWWDGLVASDPGLVRLLTALQLMLALAVTIAVVHVFVQSTHVLWVDAPTGAAATPKALALIDAQHRGITLLATLLGGLIAMMSSFAVLDRRPKEQALTMALMPVPMLATMALSVEVAGHRTLGIALLALVIGAGTYMRRFVPRFGPRAFLYGAMLFIGYIFGFLSNGAVQEGQLGGIAIVLWLAVAVNFALKLLVERPLARGRLERTARSFRARCRAVAAAGVDLLDAATPGERARARRRLDRRLVRLNETALVIDAAIGEVDVQVLGSAAFDAHDELFRLELVVHNLGRGTERFAAGEPPADAVAPVRSWLQALASGRPGEAAELAQEFQDREATSDAQASVAVDAAARVHHLSRLASATARALSTWPRHHRPAEERADGERFESAVTLIFGDLPGSALAGAEAAAHGRPGAGRLVRRLRLDPPAQVAIRVTLAVGAAAALGSVLSERRFYWAVIAVFIAFMGANTSGEQVTKVVQRVAGTVLGILVGSVLAHLVGRSPWAVVVIVGALGFGVYFLKVSYALMTVGVTIMVSQLYEQLGEYSDHLLVLRLEETAIGAVVAALAATAIFPVHTRRAARIAARGHLDALRDLLVDLRERLDDPGPDRLTTAARTLDHATHQLVVTARPLRLTPFRRRQVEHNTALFVQTAHQARNLVSALHAGAADDLRVREAVGPAFDRIAAATRDVADALGVPAAEDVADGDGPATADGPGAGDAPSIAGVDRLLAAEGVPAGDLPRLLLRRVDRLEETVAEIRGNLEPARPDRRRAAVGVAAPAAG